jgi:eukaryotic-like serine/threonine-protein kinase
MSTSGSSHTAGLLPDLGSEPASRPTSGSSGAVNCNPEEATIISQRPPQMPVAAARSTTPFELSKQLAGERLNHFQLMEYVGGGGMGAVFRALDTMLNREVALKVLSRDQGADEETRRRFQNEAQSAARLDHENIARVYYVGEDRGLNYIVFEFIEGINLREVVERQGPLALAVALSYTLQVAQALAHACGRDVVHRDIKPSNLIIMSDGRAKLVDMGLARLHQVQPDGEDLTASGVTLGTFDYISPEQARDPRVADVRSDIYSLGCTLYYMLTGRPPFPDGTVLQKLLQHNSDPPPDPREINPSLPAGVSMLVSKMLAKDPLRRYQHPSDLIADLQLLAEQLGYSLPGAQSPTWPSVLPTPRPFSGVVRHLPWMLPVATLLLVAGLLERDWPGLLDPAVDEVALRANGTGGRTAAPGPSAEKGASSQKSVSPRRSPRGPAIEPASPPEGDADDAANLRTKSVGGSDTERSGTERSDTERNDTAIPDGRAVIAEQAGGRPSDVQNNNRQVSDGAGGAKLDLAEDDDEAPRRVDDSARKNDARGDSQNTADDETEAEVGAGGRASPGSRNEEPAGSAGTATGGGTTNVGAAEGDSPSRRLVGAAPPLPDRLVAAAPPEPGVLIVGDGMKGPRRYARLTEACAAAKSGDRIELHYDGPREETPLVLADLELELRPGAGYRPIVVFRPNDTNPIAFPRSMMTVLGGSFKLAELAIELDLSRAAPSENWSLVELRSADSFAVDNCLLTVRNATEQAVAYHDKVAFFKITANKSAESMMPTSAPADPIVQVRMMNCIARGEAVFVLDQDALPFDLTWHNGLLATTERMFSLGGGAPMQPVTDDRVRIDLRRITALVRQGFCRILPALPAAPMRLEAKCDDCLFLTDADGHALFEQSGAESLDRQRARLRWRGDRNRFQGFGTFWQLASSAAPGQSSSLNYQQWLEHWNPDADSASAEDAVTLPSWRLGHPRQPLHAVTPVDFQPSREGVANTSANGPPASAGGFDPRQMRDWPAAATERHDAAPASSLAPPETGVRSAVPVQPAPAESGPPSSGRDQDPEGSLPPEMPPRSDRRLDDDRGP